MPAKLPNPVEPVPPAVGGELAKLRDKLLRQIAKYSARYASHLESDVAAAIRKIKASRYNRSIVKREVAKLCKGSESNLRTAMAELIDHASTLSGDYHTLMATYAQRRWSSMGAQGRAALAQDTLAARVARRAQRALQSAAEKIASKHIRPWAEVRMPLSRRLHKLRVAQQRSITRTVLASIRDGKNLTETGTKMIHEVRKTGPGELAGNAKVPRYMRDLEKHAKKLYARGTEADWKRWAKQRAKLRRYMDRLAEGGRVKNQLLEILQTTKDDALPQIDRIMHFHAADKQKYAADKIIRTETGAAFRSQQALSDSKHSWIIGYIWRLNRGARAGYKKRTKPRRLKGIRKRHRCICEHMDGKQVSKEWYEEHPAGGHPHCMCTFEPVVDNAKMAVLDESEL